MEKYLSYSQEVLEAKEKGLPIIALESTIISHGMPYPQNVKTAREVEQIIRDGVPYQRQLQLSMVKSKSDCQMRN